MSISSAHEPPGWDEVRSRIAGQWGMDYLFPHQQMAVHHILSALGTLGEEAQSECSPGLFVCLPTGSGKSLCFMGPAGVHRGISLVVYPLNALLRDQRAKFQNAGVNCAMFSGALNAQDREESLSAIAEMETGVILSNTESCFNPRLMDLLAVKEISFLVIDEAHLVLQWGGTFRPSLMKIIQLKAFLGDPVTAAFTATISDAERRELADLLWPEGDWQHIELLCDRPNIHYRVLECANGISALKLLLRHAADTGFSPFPEHGAVHGRRTPGLGDGSACPGHTRANGSRRAAGDRPSTAGSAAPADLRNELQFPMIVFVANRRLCEDLADRTEIWFRKWGRADIATYYYHAGLERDERTRIEREFIACNRGVIFTTKAFGTGVDIPGVRCCIHYDAPDTMEDFLQESGRAGRDRKQAYSILLQIRRRLFPPGVCRRRTALESINQEIEICSGCDVCTGTAWEGRLEDLALEGIRQRNSMEGYLEGGLLNAEGFDL